MLLFGWFFTEEMSETYNNTYTQFTEILKRHAVCMGGFK